MDYRGGGGCAYNATIRPSCFSFCFVLLFAALAGAAESIATIQELVASGKLPEAQAALTRALAARPNDAGLWNLSGVVHAQQGDLQKAEADFGKAVKFAPTSEAAWLNLGRVYVSSPDRDLAISKGMAAYEKVLSLDPANPEAHHQLALLLEWKGAFRESLAHLDRLPPEDQQRRSAVALRCADEAALGNTDAALTLVKALLDDPGLETADVLSVLPAIVRNDRVTVAMLEGLEARRLGTPETNAQLAAAYEKLGDLTAARKAYEAASRGSAPSAVLLMDLARVAWKQADYEGVLSYLAHARDLDPKNPGIHFVFGLACNELKLPIDARKSIEKALELAPENPYYNYAMGVLRTQWQDKDGALPYLQKYVAMKPDDPRGRLALGSLYFTLYKLDEAKKELAPAALKPETKEGAEYLLGRIAAQEDDGEAAIRHFRAVIELDPKAANAHAELGSVYLQREDLEAARKETELAIALDPKDYTANRNLIRIYRQTDDPRLKDQLELVKSLVADRDAQSKELQRTIEVRPY